MQIVILIVITGWTADTQAIIPTMCLKQGLYIVPGLKGGIQKCLIEDQLAPYSSPAHSLTTI